MRRDLGPLSMPFNPPLPIALQEFGRGRPVLSVVGGLHGDEYNGLYICHLFIEWLRGLARQPSAHLLRGRVRVLPAVNPPGLLVGERNWPFDNTDLDRTFPGYGQGETTQRLASWVFEALRQSTCCVDLHSSNAFIEEWPQALVYSGQPRALELARSMGLPLVWIRRLGTYSELRPQAMEMAGNIHGTLTYNLFQLGTDTLVVRAGVGLRLDPAHCRTVFAGLVRLALQLGVVSGPAPDGPPFEPSRVVLGEQLHPVHSRQAGLFVPAVATGQTVEARRTLGRIVDPLRGESLEEVCTPVRGIVCALRTHPVVLEGSLVARVAGDGA